MPPATIKGGIYMKVKEVLAMFKRVFVKRKYKDILFRFVFREKEEILQLYNAMNQTNYTNPDNLIITTMEDVIYIGMKNDLWGCFWKYFSKTYY